VQEDAFDPASHPTIEPRPLSTDHRMLVLLARMMALSRRTVRQALAWITEQLASIQAILVKRLSRRPRVLQWRATAVGLGLLTICGAWLGVSMLQPKGLIVVRTMSGVGQVLQHPQSPQEGPPHTPPPAASPPAAEVPAAPITPVQHHVPPSAASPPAAEPPTAPAAPEQDLSPPPEELYYGVVLTLHAAGFLCRRPGQSPCLREVTVHDTGGVQLGGILCDRQDAAQVRSLLQQIPGVTAVELYVNFQKSWHQRHALPGCAVRPWHKPAASSP
jgi:hypothetical protein